MQEQAKLEKKLLTTKFKSLSGVMNGILDVKHIIDNVVLSEASFLENSLMFLVEQTKFSMSGK